MNYDSRMRGTDRVSGMDRVATVIALMIAGWKIFTYRPTLGGYGVFLSAAQGHGQITASHRHNFIPDCHSVNIRESNGKFHPWEINWKSWISFKQCLPNIMLLCREL